MTEYMRLREAFVRVCGEPVWDLHKQVRDDGTNPYALYWIARNMGRQAQHPDGPDVQINAWSGDALGTSGELTPGLYCGLNIERKAAFRAAFAFANPETFYRAARELREYRVSFGNKVWPDNRFVSIDCGRRAVDVDYDAIFSRVEELHGDRILRPQLQMYRRIGGWLNPPNTVDRLAAEIKAVRHELSEILGLLTGGLCPSGDAT